MKPPPRKTVPKAVGMIRRIGERLSSEERPPYELVEHDESFDLDMPTNPQLQAFRTDEDKT